ncbi:hypothetical protein TEA_018975 [Camellia sinensis var. sinensis]|uniref:Uncharacterized protein n=1 Tax=Camellia sinensis var. sinensis TaxID=542762 RepID=A0A4S4EGM5_CAMSN|nr:hypothetical protein TEA_018975 [Camellia sinensis var. sinensis]
MTVAVVGARWTVVTPPRSTNVSDPCSSSKRVIQDSYAREDEDSKGKQLASPDVGGNERWKHHVVLGPQKPSSLRSCESSDEESLHDKRKKAKKVDKSKQHSRKHKSKSKEKSRDKKKKKRQEKRCKHHKGSFGERLVLVKQYKWYDNATPNPSTMAYVVCDIVITSQMSSQKIVMKLIGCCLEFQYPVMVYEGLRSTEQLLSRSMYKREGDMANHDDGSS